MAQSTRSPHPNQQVPHPTLRRLVHRGHHLSTFATSIVAVCRGCKRKTICGPASRSTPNQSKPSHRPNSAVISWYPAERPPCHPLCQIVPEEPRNSEEPHLRSSN